MVSYSDTTTQGVRRMGPFFSKVPVIFMLVFTTLFFYSLLQPKDQRNHMHFFVIWQEQITKRQFKIRKFENYNCFKAFSARKRKVSFKGFLIYTFYDEITDAITFCKKNYPKQRFRFLKSDDIRLFQIDFGIFLCSTAQLPTIQAEIGRGL